MVVQSMAHWVRTFSNPRTVQRRNPSSCLIQPNIFDDLSRFFKLHFGRICCLIRCRAPPCGPISMDRKFCCRCIASAPTIPPAQHQYTSPGMGSIFLLFLPEWKRLSARANTMIFRLIVDKPHGAIIAVPVRRFTQIDDDALMQVFGTG